VPVVLALAHQTLEVRPEADGAAQEPAEVQEAVTPNPVGQAAAGVAVQVDLVAVARAGAVQPEQAAAGLPARAEAAPRHRKKRKKR
jgi:hypothetical protein